jgi:hypothetical protein
MGGAAVKCGVVRREHRIAFSSVWGTPLNMSSSPRALTLLHVLLTCGLAAGLGFDEYRLANVRHEQAAAQAAVEKQKKELAANEAKSAELKERNDAYKTESETLRKRLAEMKAGKAAPIVAGAPGSDTAKADGKDGADGKSEKGKGGFGNALAQMMKDPAMKKMIMQQQGMAMRMMYGELPKQLGLDSQQSDQLMNLLTQRQMELTDKTLGAVDGSADKSAISQQTADIRAQYDQQLKALLGDSYPQLQAYEKTVGDRAEMAQFQQQFSTLGQPLSDDQRNGLLQIMMEERAGMPASPLAQSNPDVAGQISALNDDGVVHDFLAQQEALAERVLARAGTVLSPEQLTTLANLQKQMLQMQESGMNINRQMFKPQK